MINVENMLKAARRTNNIGAGGWSVVVVWVRRIDIFQRHTLSVFSRVQ